MNPEHTEIAEKVIDVFKKSKKDKLFYPNDLAHLFPNESTAKSIINNLDEIGLIKLLGEGYCRITNKGWNFKGFADLEHKAEIQNRKNILDLRLKEWQVKTFWPIFIFAIIGSGLGIYNFINSKTPSKNIERLEQKIEKIKLDLDKLQMSGSEQKIIDSLNVKSSLTNKIKK